MFKLRQVFKFDVSGVLLKKAMSTGLVPYINLTINNNGIAILGIQRPPVNSVNLELFQQLLTSLKQLENDRCRGLILTSNLPQLFSAGLDLHELINPARERLHAFVTGLHDVSIKLYASDAITTVAMNGTTAAGACVLATLLDYRVMVNKKSTISLNDSAVGIVPLNWISEAMCEIIGRKQATLALTASTQFTPEEALKVGLVDDLAVDNAEAIEKCKEFIGKFDKIPPLTRATIKRNMRRTLLEDIRNNKEKYIETLVNNILDPKTQQNIETFVSSLRSRNNDSNH